MEQIITLSNDRLTVDITNYGGRVMKWLVDGVDIVLGFDSIDQYKTAKEPYHSALIGRYSNRIANGKFTLDNQIYQLDQNHGEHILHGGSQAFHNATWEVVSQSDTYVELEHVSSDGDQGFPGKLAVTARYELNSNSLHLSMNAKTSKATPVSLTHHPYFNLSGLQSTDLDEHLFRIHSSQILATDKHGIPTGDIVGVGFTGFDFTQWKSLNKAMQESHSQIDLLGGIDHTYISVDLNADMILQAEAKTSLIHMKVYSNQAGVQFYTANHFNDSEKGKSERSHAFRGAFCLEPQQWPDSPNQENFPQTILYPNKEYLFKTKYEFPLS